MFMHDDADDALKNAKIAVATEEKNSLLVDRRCEALFHPSHEPHTHTQFIISFVSTHYNTI